jgi:hypothetical protein
MASVADALYVFGGHNGSATLGDLWQYNCTTKAWNRIEDSADAPDSRAGHGLVAAFGYIYVFGGRDGGGVLPVPYPHTTEFAQYFQLECLQREFVERF